MGYIPVEDRISVDTAAAVIGKSANWVRTGPRGILRELCQLPKKHQAMPPLFVLHQ